MSKDADQTFTGQEAAAAQTALRRVLGLEPEQFPAEAFIGMISDEIEQLRAAGHDDRSIAALVSEITRKPMTAALIERCYATPEQRGHRDGV